MKNSEIYSAFLRTFQTGIPETTKFAVIALHHSSWWFLRSPGQSVPQDRGAYLKHRDLNLSASETYCLSRCEIR